MSRSENVIEETEKGDLWNKAVNG